MRRALAVVACLAATAHADPDPKQAQAQELYVEGSKHYNLREYREAIEAFKRAYALFPEPTFLFNIGQAHRLLNDCESAAVFYRNYVRAAPDGKDRANAEQLAGEMESCAAEQKRAREDDLRRQPAVAAAAPEPRNRGLRIAGIVMAGVGAAAVGAGAVFSVAAISDGRRVEQMCSTGCNAADLASIDRDGKSWSWLALAMYVAGGAALAAGCSMLLWTGLHADPLTFIVVPTPGGAAVSTTIYF
jgi:tetratricopeptide (TPR) repeat protein